MKLINKEIAIIYKEVDSKYTVAVTTDMEGTVSKIDCYSLEEVFVALSKLTRTKITLHWD